MTEQQKAAMQQALEALLHFPGDISDEMFESIRSLKAALAEPVQEQAEPVKHKHQWFRTESMGPGQMRCIDCGKWGKEQAGPEPEPVAEPVADEVKAQALDALNRMQSIFMMPDGRHPRDVLRAFIQLVSTPPARRPLTDEELRKVLYRVAKSIEDPSIVMTHWPLVFRAAERAHGIGGNDE